MYQQGPSEYEATSPRSARYERRSTRSRYSNMNPNEPAYPEERYSRVANNSVLPEQDDRPIFTTSSSRQQPRYILTCLYVYN